MIRPAQANDEMPMKKIISAISAVALIGAVTFSTTQSASAFAPLFLVAAVMIGGAGATGVTVGEYNSQMARA
jgi:hypothetical protein